MRKHSLIPAHKHRCTHMHMYEHTNTHSIQVHKPVNTDMHKYTNGHDFFFPWKRLLSKPTDLEGSVCKRVCMQRDPLGYAHVHSDSQMSYFVHFIDFHSSGQPNLLQTSELVCSTAVKGTHEVMSGSGLG